MHIIGLLFENEYIRFAMAVGLICVSSIAVWLLFREAKLWYWKTETVLEALDTISYRLEHVEGQLDYTNRDTLDISANTHAIAFISEQTKDMQKEIGIEVKDNTQKQQKICDGVMAVHGLLVEHVKESKKETKLVGIPVQTGYISDDIPIFDNETDDLWHHESQENFEKYEYECDEYDEYEDEDEIRGKIRL